MTRLSININKVALIRNARGGNMPDLNKFAKDCEIYGADGITVHPRPDERHIRFSDIHALKKVIKTEFNVEGYPSESFISLMCSVQPDQVTLVPDKPDQITSDHGWNIKENLSFLKEVVSELHRYKIRSSLFIDPIPSIIEEAYKTGTDRIELYTESYAHEYQFDRKKAISSFMVTAKEAKNAGIGINAGHDLNLNNLRYFVQHIDDLLEVSIGHALISDALYYGIENTIQLYLKEIKNNDNKF